MKTLCRVVVFAKQALHYDSDIHASDGVDLARELFIAAAGRKRVRELQVDGGTSCNATEPDSTPPPVTLYVLLSHREKSVQQVRPTWTGLVVRNKEVLVK